MNKRDLRLNFEKNQEAVLIAAGALAIAGILGGCTTDNRHLILASTGTSIGVDIGQNPASQFPQASLGYRRVEIALVPTDRPATVDAGDKDHSSVNHAEVLMELRYNNIFNQGSDSAIYQRLAVGKKAVSHPGAIALFIRDASGAVDQDSVQAIKNLMSIGTSGSVRAIKFKISEKYRCNKIRVNEEIRKINVWEDYDHFADGNPREPTLDEASQILVEIDNVSGDCPASQ